MGIRYRPTGASPIGPARSSSRAQMFAGNSPIGVKLFMACRPPSWRVKRQDWQLAPVVISYNPSSSKEACAGICSITTAACRFARRQSTLTDRMRTMQRSRLRSAWCPLVIFAKPNRQEHERG
jgi:hypothetical protein